MDKLIQVTPHNVGWLGKRYLLEINWYYHSKCYYTGGLDDVPNIQKKLLELGGEGRCMALRNFSCKSV